VTERQREVMVREPLDEPLAGKNKKRANARKMT